MRGRAKRRQQARPKLTIKSARQRAITADLRSTSHTERAHRTSQDERRQARSIGTSGV
jgi:hypothetical protein